MEEKRYKIIHKQNRYGHVVTVCHCDMYIASVSGRTGTFHFLSLFGREDDVKVITAEFIEHGELATGNIEVKKQVGAHYRMLTRKSPGVLHRIIYNAGAFGSRRPNQVVIGSSESEVAACLVKAMDRALDTPLWEGWSKELFNWLSEGGFLGNLELYGFPENTVAYEINMPQQEILEQYICSMELPWPTGEISV